MTTSIQPLTREHQMFLQRFMASHCLSHVEASSLFENLGVPNNSVEEAFRQINRSLSPAFGLEIATVVWKQDKQKYHAIVSRWKEDSNPQEENPTGPLESHMSPHEKQLVRLVLDALVQSPNGSLPRKDLVNLRSNLDGVYHIETVAHAEYVVDQLLIAEKWLQLDPSYDTQLQLAPRALLEFPGYLTSIGMSEEELPQYLFHRA